MVASGKVKKVEEEKVNTGSGFSPRQIKKFVEDVKTEFTKIVWPDKKMTLGLTGVVVVLTIIISLYLGAVDLLLGKVVGTFLR